MKNALCKILVLSLISTLIFSSIGVFVAASDSADIYITATITGPPVLDSIGGKSVVENSPLIFTVNATAPNGDNLTFTHPHAGELPQGATFSTTLSVPGHIEGEFSWTPTYFHEGEHQVTFEVADDKGASDEETITITVTDGDAIEVGGPSPDFAMIQEAIDNTESGNNIYVHSGTYSEDIDMKSGLNLIGKDARTTFIEGSVLFIEDDAAVENFTILYDEGEYVSLTNLHYTDWQILADAGITAIDSEIAIKNCIIRPDLDRINAEGGYDPPLERYGKGIQIWNMYQSIDKSPTIQNNLIMNANIGISLFSQRFGGSVVGQLKNNTLVSNDCGILMRMHKENPLIQDNIITDSFDSAICITYEDGTLLDNRIANILGNDFFNNNYDVYCDELQQELAPLPDGITEQQGNLYEDPLFDSDYITQNPACAGKGYSLP